MQVLIDNLVYSPVFNLLVMAYIATVVEGKPHTSSWSEVAGQQFKLLMLCLIIP